ncbi:MAG: alpha/beta hydrolase [Caulobacter sp.]|nr:alpha/beta hydrolase [Caulobacter sp.]
MRMGSLGAAAVLALAAASTALAAPGPAPASASASAGPDPAKDARSRPHPEAKHAEEPQAAPPPDSPAPDDFAPCDDAETAPALTGSLCARFQAPLSPENPDLGQVELFVRKFPAEGRAKGQAWLIAGGPGESGASLYPFLDPLRTAFAGYDLIVPDHRGSGLSTRLCPDQEAADSPGGYALEGKEAAACLALVQAKGARAQAFTISNAARDLSALMARYKGGGRTVLYGVSYGTQLVLRTLVVAPPAKLDAVVLDSLAPPEGDNDWDVSHRPAIADAVGRKVLAECDAWADCHTQLGGSALKTAEWVASDPKRAAAFPDRKPKPFLGALLDDPEARTLIPDVVVGARDGKPEAIDKAKARLEAVDQRLAAYPQARLSVPLAALIDASENDARPDLTRKQADAETKDLIFTASAPGWLAGWAAGAYPRDDVFGKTPAKLPPTLVLQGDLDARTPYEGAMARLDQLKGAGKVSLVTVKGGANGLLMTQPDCFTASVGLFIDKRRAPPATCGG